MKNKVVSLQIAIEKYHHVINHLIKESFPSLKRFDIKIIESKKIEISADAKKFKDYLQIRTNQKLRDYKNELLKGIFSHELSHLEDFIKSNKLNLFLYEMCYNFQKSFKKNTEKEMDITAIKKGYAGYLYLQRKDSWKKTDRKTEKLKRIYLSPKEIKEISIKMNQWPGKHCSITKKELKGKT